MKYTRRDMSKLIQRVGDLGNRVRLLEITINEQKAELKQMKCSHVRMAQGQGRPSCEAGQRVREGATMKTKFIVEKPLEERAEVMTEFCLRNVGHEVELRARVVGGGDIEYPIVRINGDGTLSRCIQALDIWNTLGLRSDVKNRIYIEENE